MNDTTDARAYWRQFVSSRPPSFPHRIMLDNQNSVEQDVRDYFIGKIQDKKQDFVDNVKRIVVSLRKQPRGKALPLLPRETKDFIVTALGILQVECFELVLPPNERGMEWDKEVGLAELAAELTIIPSLQEVSLENNNSGRNQLLCRLLTAPTCDISHLEFDTSPTSIHDETVQSFETALKECPGVRRLQSIKWNPKNSAATGLCSLLEYCTGLKTLKFVPHFPLQSLGHLTGILQRCPQLESLETTAFVALGNNEEDDPTISLSEVVQNHANLQCLTVAFKPEFVPSAIAFLMRLHQSHCRVETVDFQFASLKKGVCHLDLDKLEFDTLCEMRKVLAQFCTIATSLNAAYAECASESLHSIFHHPGCSVKDLDTNLEFVLMDQEFIVLRSALAGYNKLETLCAGVKPKFPLETLCPYSPLKEVKLSIGGSEKQSYQCLANFLHHHQQISHFSIHCRNFTWSGEDHGEEEDIAGGANDKPLFPDRVLQTHQGLKSLKISGYGVLSSEYLDRFCSSFDTNLKLEYFESASDAGSIQRHKWLNRILLRNRLLNKTQEAGNMLPSLSTGIWPKALAKLASNDGDGSALFSFLKNGAEALSNFHKVSRKRNAENTTQDQRKKRQARFPNE